MFDKVKVVQEGGDRWGGRRLNQDGGFRVRKCYLTRKDYEHPRMFEAVVKSSRHSRIDLIHFRNWRQVSTIRCAQTTAYGQHAAFPTPNLFLTSRLASNFYFNNAVVFLSAL